MLNFAQANDSSKDVSRTAFREEESDVSHSCIASVLRLDWEEVSDAELDKLSKNFDVIFGAGKIYGIHVSLHATFLKCLMFFQTLFMILK